MKTWPAICSAANLPSFATITELNQYRRRIGMLEHPFPVLAQWQCKACNGLHYWSMCCRTDSNGRAKGGSDRIPARILKLIERTKI